MFGGDREELESRRRARVEAEDDLRENLVFGSLRYENGWVVGAIDRNGRRHRGRRHFSEKTCFRRRLLEMPSGMAGYIMSINVRERGDKAKDEENTRRFAELKTVPYRLSYNAHRRPAAQNMVFYLNAIPSRLANIQTNELLYRAYGLPCIDLPLTL